MGIMDGLPRDRWESPEYVHCEVCGCVKRERKSDDEGRRDVVRWVEWSLELGAWKLEEKWPQLDEKEVAESGAERGNVRPNHDDWLTTCSTPGHVTRKGRIIYRLIKGSDSS